MQLEWNRFLSGIVDLKENHGFLWLVSVALLVLGIKKVAPQKQRLLMAGVLLGVLVIFPLTAVMLLEIYTPFYDWNDLQQMFPITLLISYGIVGLYDYLRKQNVPGVRLGQSAQNMISGICIILLLMVSTNFHGFDGRQEADERGIPVESAEVFGALWQVVGEEPIVLAAPPEMLQYARLYESAWRPVYGRDLWSSKSASYINSGYDMEYQYYTLLTDARLPEDECTELISLINKGYADCIIVPDFWLEIMSGMPEYESVRLTSSYIGIMKRDLLVE